MECIIICPIMHISFFCPLPKFYKNAKVTLFYGACSKRPTCLFKVIKSTSILSSKILSLMPFFFILSLGSKLWQMFKYVQEFAIISEWCSSTLVISKTIVKMMDKMLSVSPMLKPVGLPMTRPIWFKFVIRQTICVWDSSKWAGL